MNEDNPVPPTTGYRHDTNNVKMCIVEQGIWVVWVMPPGSSRPSSMSISVPYFEVPPDVGKCKFRQIEKEYLNTSILLDTS